MSGNESWVHGRHAGPITGIQFVGYGERRVLEADGERVRHREPAHSVRQDHGEIASDRPYERRTEENGCVQRLNQDLLPERRRVAPCGLLRRQRLERSVD